MNQQKLDPLRRVFVPIVDKLTGRFRTLDGERYVRLECGTIRRVVPKVRGKAARRREREARRLGKGAKRA